MEAVGFLRAIIAGAIVLGVLVLVHEWGHFIVAKLCGVRVDVFSIGFGKRLWGVKRGDTDYRVSALPLGGYVRMAGDNPVEERTGAAYEFLSRPRWQRFLIAIAGPAMNILVTLLIFWGIFSSVGIPYVPPTIDQVQAGSAAENSGLKSGDAIVSIDGKSVRTSADSVAAIRSSKGQPIHVIVNRDGKDMPLTISPNIKRRRTARWCGGSAQGSSRKKAESAKDSSPGRNTPSGKPFTTRARSGRFSSVSSMAKFLCTIWGGR